MEQPLTEFICINYDLELIYDELIQYKIKANKETIQQQYFLHNRDLVETIFYFVTLKYNSPKQMPRKKTSTSNFL